ncbi:uncharacterized protein LOC117647854 [Thrips palmi]|uniref:Uncharacterized protein LOC117647854 n=1 Tax=Thrips palmi TaxID=161013 RepID=A0A6P8ZBY1_THRPL|nr:uncharacterized protein LOC117647854 [Thrips palmi]
MDPTDFNDFLDADVKRVLPHLKDDDITALVNFLIIKGCKKERDLRIMTIPILESQLDLVDATDLYNEWQAKYGASQPSTSSNSHAPEVNSAPSTSRGVLSVNSAPSTSRGVLSERQLRQEVEAQQFGMPTFDKDSPYMPAGVRQAILENRRPLPRHREDMVERMVDYCRETVPNLSRKSFNSVADSLVTLYPNSFEDSIAVNNRRSNSLRAQFKSKFDNDRRPTTFSKKEVESPNIPSAFGCISWSPILPDGETEESLLQKKETLQDMFRLSKKQWNWKSIKGHLQSTFYLQRKEINGPASASASASKSKKRKRVAEEENEVDQPRGMTVGQIAEEWPFLFKAKGMNIHFTQLTGVDFKEKFNNFINQEGTVLVEYLACKSEDLAKIRRKMTRAEARSLKSTTAKAVIQMIIIYFKEKLEDMAVFVEETTTIDDVNDVATYPEDGTPSLIVAGQNLFSASTFFLTVDQQVVASTSHFEEAFCMLFGSYFMLNLKFSSKLEISLTFVQKVIAQINPEQGSKGDSTASVRRQINNKVLRLSNGLQDFKQKVTSHAQIVKQEYQIGY